MRALTKIAYIPLILIIGAIGVQTMVSCSGDEGGGGDPSSSSRGGSSSSSGNIISYCDTLTYANVPPLPPCENGIVEIGSQVWQKCNSKVEPSTGNSWCYCDKPENCEIYGRLYDWDAAMSACPSGWHLPTTTDWSTLLFYVEYDKKDDEDYKGYYKGDFDRYDYCGNYYRLCDSNCDTCYYGEYAGRLLRSASGWRIPAITGNQGTDDYGFSALPGGIGRHYLSGTFSSFSGIGVGGTWWTANENKDRPGIAYAVDMPPMNRSVSPGDRSKDAGHSVRCIQD